MRNTEELQVFLVGHPTGSYLAVFKRVRGFWVYGWMSFAIAMWPSWLSVMLIVNSVPLAIQFLVKCRWWPPQGGQGLLQLVAGVTSRVHEEYLRSTRTTPP